MIMVFAVPLFVCVSLCVCVYLFVCLCVCICVYECMSSVYL